ncbi:tetratricopeptide repeat protein [Mucilaginibacter gotjawali]|uniref:Tetratricopeptide (TPR) repeat protein n=2 Tax=Mucilaginibacter gotjawali TaxID=1550579 RepID=A0A839SKM5_9SPHI|nr:tetratricopeptide repeat protein [Mucilaginibacter gotjawali]MBB3058042.1 tetratricopeptide (TPR) repeat protein [Mucilaginibacter gotjawali]BAU52017.1 Tetratricopeptide repeat protein [Mucilaginibacter gotjawali]
MRTLRKILLVLIVFSLAGSSVAFSQDQPDAKSLINEGIALNDSGKYVAAIEKYKAALKIDPENLQVQYEMSYTLFSSGRGDDAIPLLEKVAPSNRYAEAYDLLASIYDDKKDFEKSIAYYQQGIIAFPDYQRLRFNLAVSYLRQKRYPEAEQAAIKAIQLDPKHASSQRAYALAMYHQNRGAASIMAFCSFLMLEPQTKRSAEAYQYVQSIIKSKVTVDTANGKKSVTIRVQDNKENTDESALDMFLSMIAASPTLDENKNKPAVDILNEELSTLFEEGGELGEKKREKDFFWKFYVDYFYKLAQSNNMPAFARFISLSAYREEDLQWFKDNDSKLTALDTWVSNTKREVQ